MPSQPAPTPSSPYDRETASAVIAKWMAGVALSPSEAILISRLRAVNMAQQLATAVLA